VSVGKPVPVRSIELRPEAPFSVSKIVETLAAVSVMTKPSGA